MLHTKLINNKFRSSLICISKIPPHLLTKTNTLKINHRPTSPRHGSYFTISLLIGMLCFTNQTIAKQNNSIPEWNPQSSEKLVKLPSTYLKKSIESDFADSKLGMAIEVSSEETRLKILSLADLKNAIDQAEGDIKTELRHQLLGEKRAYVNIVSHKNKMRWKQLMTKQRLFERILKKISQKNISLTPNKKILIEKQEAAKKRFNQSMSKVDLKLFETASIPESTYSRKYSKNMAVINQLLTTVNKHRMTRAVQLDGRQLNKQEYIQQLLSDTQSEIAILEQEETILGYMAKLVALDALTLSEEALDAELADSDIPSDKGPAEAANLFLND
jgi:hypothetical protein